MESSDCQLFAGPMFTDYTTVGWTTNTTSPKLIHAGSDLLRWSGHEYTGLRLASLLDRLASKVKKNAASLANYQRPQSAAAG